MLRVLEGVGSSKPSSGFRGLGSCGSFILERRIGVMKG